MDELLCRACNATTSITGPGQPSTCPSCGADALTAIVVCDGPAETAAAFRARADRARAAASGQHACEHCGGTLWEDAEDGGRCVGCGKRPLYTMRRADGWPLCPDCENDELYSLHVPATIATICGCYVCGWMPPLKGIRIVDA